MSIDLTTQMEWTNSLKDKLLICILKNQKTYSQKAPCPNTFNSEFHQTFKKEIIPILYKIFKKIEETFANSFNEGCQIPNQT